MAVTTIQFGRNGPQVGSIGSGLMSLGHAYGSAGDTPTRLKYLDELYEAGSHFWDTADVYGDCEDVVGQWFQLNPDKRKDIFLATKFGLDFSGGFDHVKVNGTPEYVQQAFEKSLKRLHTTYVDLYYCHRVDGVTPIERTVGAMAELQKQNKIRYLGLSEVSSRTLRRACAVHPITALQIEYSPFALEIETPQGKSKESILSVCKELGIAIVAYSPLGRGFLTGAIKSPSDIGDSRTKYPAFQEESFHKNMALVKRLEQVTNQVRSRSGRSDISQAQVVLAWLVKQGNMVLPIPGTKTISRARENLGAKQIELTDEELKAIRDACEEIKRVGARYPDAVAGLLVGDTPEL